MSLHPLDSLELAKEKKYNLYKLRKDVHKLKEVFVDTIKFAIDKDLVKNLHTLLMLRKFHRKLGMYMNEIMKTEKVEIISEKTSALFDKIDMLGESLEDIKEDIKLELSYLEIREQYNISLEEREIREQYNLSTLSVETDEYMTASKEIENMLFMTDSKEFEYMMILLQYDLGLQDEFYRLDKF